MSRPAIPQFALNQEIRADLDVDAGSGTLPAARCPWRSVVPGHGDDKC